MNDSDPPVPAEPGAPASGPAGVTGRHTGSGPDAQDATAEGAAPRNAAASPTTPAPAAKKPKTRSARRRSREFALQGLYEWLVSGTDAGVIDAHVRELEEFELCDRDHFDALLHGAIDAAASIDTLLAKHVDRPTTQLSPVEHGVLMIGVHELRHCLDIPYKVAINEAVEVAKTFGGTDGHKYVNGVLDKAAAELRPVEVGAARGKRR